MGRQGWYLPLFMVLVLVIAGCGNQANNNNQSNNQNDQTSTSTTDTGNNTSSTDTTETPSTDTTSTDTTDTETSTTETEENTTDTSTASNIEVKNPDTLVLVSTVIPLTSLDPAYSYNAGSGAMIFNIMETLIFYDGEHPDKFIPMLATEVPSNENGLISEDALTYTFPIRTGTKFHAGPVTDASGNVIPGSGELTPEDVTYSMHRLILTDRAGGPNWMMIEPILGTSSVKDLGEQIEGVEVENLEDLSTETLLAICEQVKDAIYVDGNNVVFTLKSPFSPFLQIIVGYWASVLDKEWMMTEILDADGNVEKGAGWNGSCSSWQNYYDPQIEDSVIFDKANGTGPYILERWRKEEEVYLKANPDYWRERPANLDVSYQASSEMATRLLMMQQGDADIIAVPIANQDQIFPLVEEGLVTMYENLPTGVGYFWTMNHHVDTENNDYIGSGELDGDGVPPNFFSDIDVRKGFGYAFDWETYWTDVINKEGNRMRSPLHSEVFGANPDQEVYDVDLEKAEEHLRKAWGGELWEQGFKLIVPYVTGGQAVKLTTEIMARNLENINPKFQLIPQDFQRSKLVQDNNLGKIPFDYNGWGEDYHDPHNWAFPILHSLGNYARHFGLEPDLQAQLDDLINQARGELDPERRKALYHELQQINFDEAIIITLEEWTRRRFMRSWLQGYVHNTGYPSYYYWHFDKAES